MNEALVDAAHHKEVEEGVLADVVDANRHHQEQLQAEVLETGGLVAHQELVEVRDQLQAFSMPTSNPVGKVGKKDSMNS